MDENVVELIDQARERARSALVAPGDWYDGASRREMWLEARSAAHSELDHDRKLALSPFAVAGSHPAGERLSATEVDAVHRIASDPGRLSRAWAEEVMAEIGEEPYVELVAVVASAAVLDTFDRVLGQPLITIPEPIDGVPARERPDGVGDVGAWVAQTVDTPMANVSRAASLVPVTERSWVSLVRSHYSRDAFGDLAWERALSRPQVEIVAARTTTHLECFY